MTEKLQDHCKVLILSVFKASELIDFVTAVNDTFAHLIYGHMSLTEQSMTFVHKVSHRDVHK